MHCCCCRQVLDRVRAVAAAKGKHIGCLLDTKGPEIRTAMLKGGENIELKVGDQAAPAGAPLHGSDVPPPACMQYGPQAASTAL